MLGEELVPARLGTPHLTCRHGLLLLELEPALSSQGRIGPAQISRGALPSIFGWLYHMSRGGASNTQGVASRRQGVESKVNGFLTSRVNLSRMRAMRPGSIGRGFLRAASVLLVDVGAELHDAVRRRPSRDIGEGDVILIHQLDFDLLASLFHLLDALQIPTARVA